MTVVVVVVAAAAVVVVVVVGWSGEFNRAMGWSYQRDGLVVLTSAPYWPCAYVTSAARSRASSVRGVGAAVSSGSGTSDQFLSGSS